MLDRIYHLIVKELLAVWRDRQSRTLLVVPPLIYMLVFTFAATQEVTNVPIAVLNEDSGIYARDLVERIEGSPNFSRVLRLGSDADVSQAIDRQEALMVVRFGVDFSREIAAGRPARVQLRSTVGVPTRPSLSPDTQAISLPVSTLSSPPRGAPRRWSARCRRGSGSTRTWTRGGARYRPWWPSSRPCSG